MLAYSRETVAQVLTANDIADIIGARVELKAAGTGRFKALCPFHNEKTPSFNVDRGRQAFFCFGCEKGGDAISFLREYEGLTFPEALRQLADKAGIQLPSLSPRDDKEDFLRTRLLELSKFADKFFRAMMADPLKGSPCRNYLKTRALKPETIEKFALGFAPEGWSNLMDAARKERFEEEMLETAGLVKRGEKGNCYDFFRNRLIVPIRDVGGHVVAFGGRALDDSPAKYINSPENAIYKKGRILYGLYEARNAMRKQKQAILVEGYFDVLQCVDAGVEHVVATCGTALTPDQATLIRRYVPEAVVLYDGDAAGVRAALRGIAILMAAGLSVRALALPDGNDPDDYIQAHGVDEFRTLLDHASDFISFYVEQNGERLHSVEGRTDVAKELFTILLSVDDVLRRDEYLKRVAHQLHIDEWTCRSEFRKWEHQRSAGSSIRTSDRTEEVTTRPVNHDDCVFVAALLNDGSLMERVRQEFAELPPMQGPVNEVLAELLNGTGADLAQHLEGEAAQLYAAAAISAGEQAAAGGEAVVEKRLRRFRHAWLEAEIPRVVEEIRDAERSKDQQKVMELLSRKRDLSRKLEKVGSF